MYCALSGIISILQNWVRSETSPPCCLLSSWTVWRNLPITAFRCWRSPGLEMAYDPSRSTSAPKRTVSRNFWYWTALILNSTQYLYLILNCIQYNNNIITVNPVQIKMAHVKLLNKHFYKCKKKKKVFVNQKPIECFRCYNIPEILSISCIPL